MFVSQFFCIITIVFGAKWALGDICNLQKVDLQAYDDGYVKYVITSLQGDETSICVTTAELNKVPWEASARSTECVTGQNTLTSETYYYEPAKLGDTAYFNITVTRGEQKCSSGLINVTITEIVPRSPKLI